MISTLKRLEGRTRSHHFCGQFPSSAGQETIYFRLSGPEKTKKDRPNLVVYFLHGAVEYHGRHFLLPEFLEQDPSFNLYCVWVDLKGHGLSSGSRSHIDHFDEFLGDIVRLLNMPLDLDEAFRLVVAHSMGGVVALNTYFKYERSLAFPLHGMIFSNPALRPRFGQKHLEKFLKLNSPTLLRKMRLPRLVHGQDLTRDPYLAQQFHADQLISPFVTLGLATELLRAVEEIRNLAYYLDIPSLFLLSGNDRLVDPEETQLFIKGIDPELKTLHFYDQMYHELFNDQGRERVFADIQKWIHRLLDL